MNDARAKQILEAAATLPPANARVLVAAVAAKAGTTKRTREDKLADAARLFESAMIEAALDALEEET